METKETINIFSGISGEYEKVFDNYYNKACLSIGLSVSSGSVSAKGRLSPDDSLHDLSFVDYSSGEITDTASQGLFTVLGSENLYSIVFIGENADAYAKFLF